MKEKKRSGADTGYEDRFERYLSGGLDSEEAGEIEEDIEKFQVLFSHLDQELDQKLYEEEMNEEEDSEEKKKLRKEISRAVSRKFRNYTITAIVIAICLIPAFLAGISTLLDWLCYSPDQNMEIIDEENDSAIVINPFAMHMSVYMELFCGDKGFTETVSRPEGYGRYTIDVQTQIDGENTSHLLELVRNHLYRNDLFWNRSDFPDNAFTYKNKEVSCSIGKEEAVKKLSGLPDAMKIRAAVSFDETKNMEELVKFMKKYDTYYLYCPVVVEGWGGYWGFAPEIIGYDRTDCYDTQKYPYLDIHQYYETSDQDTIDEQIPAKVYEKHMESMIRYLMDQEDFLEIFDSDVPGKNLLNPYKYQTALDYIQQNGVKSYGTVVYGTKQELLEMLEDASVDGVYMLDGKLDLND